jgi:zinc transporter ZupT
VAIRYSSRPRYRFSGEESEHLTSTPQIVAYLVILVGGTLIGGLVPLLRAWSRESLGVLLAFASGILLAVIFLQMIPTTIELIGAEGGAAILAGFILTSLLESGLHTHRHTGGHDHEGQESIGLAGAVVAIGLALHSMLDGLVLGAGMTLPDLAPSVFLAILIHKGPDAFALTTILMAARHKTGRIAWIQGVFSLTTPLAALLAYLILRPLPGRFLGLALGVASGILLAVASEDLLPEVHRQKGRYLLASAAALAVGIALVAGYTFLFHQH